MEYPRLRVGVDVYVEAPDSIHFLFGSSGLQKTFEADLLLVELVKLLDGTRTAENILTSLQKHKRALSMDELAAVLDALLEEQIVEDAANPLLQTPSEERRYERQYQFWKDFQTPNLSPVSIQRRLRDAEVVIFGLGGIGAWVAQALAMVGVGRLVLCDFDRVELSNLTRQPLYQTNDLGRLKIAVAKERFAAVNPDVEILGQEFRLDGKADLGDLIRTATIVVNCTDMPSTTQTGLWVSQACTPRKIPHIISGGYHGHLGLVGPTILPYETACWACISDAIQAQYTGWVQVRPAGHAGRVGSIGPLASMVASVQAWEAIRVITDIAPPQMVNRTAEIDFLGLRWEFAHYQKNPHCPLCGSNKGEEIA